MKIILYAIFALIAFGIATILVLSAKVIGFFIGIIISIAVVAIVIFFVFTLFINGASRSKEDEHYEYKPTKDESYSKSKEEDRSDPHTRVFK